jgi:RNA polymerase sigma-70 factor (ECF subfamily)
MREVLEHLSKLPRAQRDVLALCVWSGLSYEEAALALAIPVGTVRSRLARARAALTEPQGHSRHKEVEMELKGIAEK